MENQYYKEILEEIHSCIDREDFEKAQRLIENELEMPYIPSDFEMQLNTLILVIREKLPQKLKPELKREELIQGLKGTKDEQIFAVEALNELNCRQYIPEIQDFFNENDNRILQSLLIDTLIDQGISEEFKIVKDGIEISFIPRYAEKVQDSDGFIKANEYLNLWLEKEPGLLSLARQILASECFMALPQSFEEDEGLPLALAICKDITDKMDDKGTFERIKSEFKLNNCVMLTLKSNNN